MIMHDFESYTFYAEGLYGFSNYSWPQIHDLVSCMGTYACAGFVTAGGGGNWIKIVCDQILERSVRGMGFRGPLKGSWCLWWGPGAEPPEAPGFLGF